MNLLYILLPCVYMYRVLKVSAHEISDEVMYVTANFNSKGEGNFGHRVTTGHGLPFS